ncbi:MAG: non-heme iron oxygenase ferredoxin subunit [Thaumarchaeota archaeon]|nr:non-heme iron oxygenase ferredoxin subunit [Nitrososphaerota archaeon]
MSEFVKVARKQDVSEGTIREVKYNEESVCLANIGGKYYAIGNICTHEGGPLAEGTFQDFEVECPWHNARFDMRTGEVLSPPAEKPVPTYEVVIKEDDIFIRKIK